MNWLADENIPIASIRLLQQAGIGVMAVGECCQGCDDEQVIDIAHKENRGLLTFDSDFGELIFRRNLPCPPAVVYNRFVPQSPEEPATAILNLLESIESIEGHFIVLDRDSFRRRKLPARKP